MDYKETIEAMRSTDVKVVLCHSLDAADAIETLLAERDAAVENLKFSGGKRCRFCIYNDRSIHDFPCNSCCETGGMSEYWEWCGPQKGDGHGDLPPM